MSGGQQISVGQGTISAHSNTRPFITVQQGILTASGNAITVNISGEEIQSAPGTISPAAPLLLGQAITKGQGSLTVSQSKALTGLAATSTIGTMISGQQADDTFVQTASGTISSGRSKSLTGSAITAGIGTLVYSAGLLVGTAATFAQGSNAILVRRALTGRAITSGQGTIKVGSIPIVGSKITMAQGTLTSSGGTPVAATPVGLTMRQLAELRRKARFKDDEAVIALFMEFLNKTIKDRLDS